jgi:putative transposase
VIVEMRTCAQAAKVTEATGGVQLPGRPRTDGTVPTSRWVDVGDDFEIHRAAVESVSTLFSLYSGNAADYACDGELGAPLHTGWSTTAAKFEVEWPTDPQRRSAIRAHFGARRKAFNWAVGQVKSDMDAKKLNPNHPSVPWELGALRKEWNRVKDQVAPWWSENSKECYSSGIADAVTALTNWKSSKTGARKGKRVGFPRFKSARKDSPRVRFTTGTMRFESDRRTVVLPVIGPLRAMENTRRVQRHLVAGRARILNMTLSEQWGRLFVSVNYSVRTPNVALAPKNPAVRAGVDLGLRTLATVAAIDEVTGEETIADYPNPAPLRASLRERRRTGRELSRRIPGSRGWKSAKAMLTRLDRRCVHLRREATHQLTTELSSEYGYVVIEDLDIAAMKRGMGRRAFRRSVSDAAMGLVRPQLAYKTVRHGATLTVADRWFPSSQIHHGCFQPDGSLCRLESKRDSGKIKLDKVLRCPITGEDVDRDINAARNLRDWPDMPVDAQLGRRPRPSAGPETALETAARTVGTTDGLGSSRKTARKKAAASSEGRTKAARARSVEEPRKRSA